MQLPYHRIHALIDRLLSFITSWTLRCER